MEGERLVHCWCAHSNGRLAFDAPRVRAEVVQSAVQAH